MSVMMRLRRAVRKMAQLVADSEHWNRLNPESQPIDVETDRVFVFRANALLARLDAGEEIPDDEMRLFEGAVQAGLVATDSLPPAAPSDNSQGSSDADRDD